jgi:hypothetical protein
VNLEDSCERRVFAYPCPTKSFGDDTVVCSEIACEPLLSSYTESCPLTGPYLAFGEGCCGGAAVLATNRLCEVKRYVSQRLVSGCTVVGCSMCMGGEGYKQCISQGCYGDPNYEWYALRYTAFHLLPRVCFPHFISLTCFFFFFLFPGQQKLSNSTPTMGIYAPLTTKR